MEWNKGYWLFQQFEDAGFGLKVTVKPLESLASAKSLEEMTENLLLAQDMFCKGWKEEEIAKLGGVVLEEVRSLKGFEEVDGGVVFKRTAWVAVAQK